jgi:hypothetical protein
MFKKLWQWFKRLFKKNHKQVRIVHVSEIKREETPKTTPTVIAPHYHSNNYNHDPSSSSPLSAELS